MRRAIFLFLDGVGFGSDDPKSNPLVAGRYPTLSRLAQGKPLTAATGRIHSEIADIVPLDACMGVEGRPQSATGQATLLTGKNVPLAIGEHYGPRPDDRIRAQLDASNLFKQLREQGLLANFVNAYPPRFHASVKRGKRLLSSIQYAVTSAGLPLHDESDLTSGAALSVEYTNASWRDHLGYQNAPVYQPAEAGRQLWRIAQPCSFIMHDNWLTDELGHHQDMEGAIRNFTLFDGVLGGLLDVIDLSETLIVVASDHGNVEDCSHGKHTLNPAFCMVIGNRQGLPVEQMRSLCDVAPLIRQFLMMSSV